LSEDERNAIADLRRRGHTIRDIGARRGRAPSTSVPPAGFVVEGSAPDVSERVEEILAAGLGRRPA
jgi:hypothetical protein